MARLSTQAAKIAAKFGGFPKLAKAVKRTPATVYRWSYPKNRGGTGGVIPSSATAAVIAAAKRRNIRIPAADWTP